MYTTLLEFTARLTLPSALSIFTSEFEWLSIIGLMNQAEVQTAGSPNQLAAGWIERQSR